MESEESPKKPKIMIVGAGFDPMGAGHIAMTRAMALMEDTHDIELISPEQAKALGEDFDGTILPFNAPPPIPILEEPLTLVRNQNYIIPDSGRVSRNKKRKGKKKRNRRY